MDKKNNGESGLSQKAVNAESNLIETPLPALYKRGIAKCFPLYLFQSFTT